MGKSSQSAGNIKPEFVEWMMGLPIGWTDLRVSSASLRRVPWQDTAAVAAIPRTLSDVPDRRNKLMALGNGLVPQVAEVALDILLEGP